MSRGDSGPPGRCRWAGNRRRPERIASAGPAPPTRAAVTLKRGAGPRRTRAPSAKARPDGKGQRQAALGRCQPGGRRGCVGRRRLDAAAARSFVFIRALLVIRHDRAATPRDHPATATLPRRAKSPASEGTGVPMARSLCGDELAKRWLQHVVRGGRRRQPPEGAKPGTKALSMAAARRNLCPGGGLSREQQQQTEIAS